LDETASAQLAVADQRQRCTGLGEREVDVARSHVQDRLRAAAIGDMRELQAEPTLHHLDGEVRHPAAGR
jgi:hypothetical protein